MYFISEMFLSLQKFFALNHALNLGERGKLLINFVARRSTIKALLNFPKMLAGFRASKNSGFNPEVPTRLNIYTANISEVAFITDIVKITPIRECGKTTMDYRKKESVNLDVTDGQGRSDDRRLKVNPIRYCKRFAKLKERTYPLGRVKLTFE